MTPDPGRLEDFLRGEAFLAGQVARLDDQAVAAPCALPGWTRAHLLAHLARNADALGNLLAWARTGVESPMYASPEARAAEIEASSRQAPGPLREDVAAASARLVAAVDALPEPAWDAPVRTARGRAITAAEVPWMRIRESWVHGVDLATGATFADLPAQVVRDLIDEVAGGLVGRDDCPAMRLAAEGDAGTWTVGPEDGPRVEVTGPAPDLLAWLIGRSDGAGTLEATTTDGRPPTPPDWL